MTQNYQLANFARQVTVNTAANVMSLPISVSIGNSTVNVSINSTSFSGVSNNSLYLGGTVAASYVQNTDSRTLSGNLTFTGQAILGPGGTGATYVALLNGSSAAGAGVSLDWQKNGTTKWRVGHRSVFIGSGTLDDFAIYNNSLSSCALTIAIADNTMTSLGPLVAGAPQARR